MGLFLTVDANLCTVAIGIRHVAFVFVTYTLFLVHVEFFSGVIAGRRLLARLVAIIQIEAVATFTSALITT